jgi:tRNA-2-methylthio-N6-dimethylallyladenosine synthase
LIHKVRFDSVFGFKYSRRQGTAAAKVPDDVTEAEKTRRLAKVFEAAEVYRQARLAEYSEQVVEVLVEGPSKRATKPGAPPQLTGRTRSNVVVNFPVTDLGFGAWRWVGKLAEVQVKRVLAHSLYGEIPLVQ